MVYKTEKFCVHFLKKENKLRNEGENVFDIDYLTLTVFFQTSKKPC